MYLLKKFVTHRKLVALEGTIKLISYIYKKMGIKIKHLWFGIVSSSINEKDCDIIFAHSLSKEYVSDKNFLIKNSQYTLITDLTDIEECLFSAIKKIIDMRLKDVIELRRK